MEEVTVNGYPLRVLPGSYKRDPAPRFGEKISTGDLRYQDFNPYESAASYSSFTRGYGLRRFSDLPQGDDPEGFYAESSNVDCRAPGVCLSPAVAKVSLTAGLATTSETPVWFGEWTPSAGTVTGNRWVMVTYRMGSVNASVRVYYFTAATTAVDTGYSFAIAGPLTDAGIRSVSVVPAGGQLIIGFGANAVAQSITTLDASVAADNVQDTGTNNLFVFASAADRASIYIAGGTAATNTNTVLSAPLTAANVAHGFATAANAVTCGDTNQAITALAPGGGIAGALVFVGKTGQLGYIDSSSVYHTAQSFQRVLSSNCYGMRWWLDGNDKTDAGTVLIFPLGRSLWSYNTSAGMTNMAAEGREGFRPINARGVVSAIQPSTHFLYYAVTNQAGTQAFIIANDGVSGANHTYRTLVTPAGGAGFASSYAMGITSLFGSNPLLYVGTEGQLTPTASPEQIDVIILPADGDWPPGDSNVTYDLGASNTLQLPDIDFGFPDEDKIPTFLRIVADSLVSGAQYITASYAADGSRTYTTLGTFFVSPIQDIPFPSMTFKRLSIKLNFVTNNTTKTPILNAISLRASINPKQYTLWSFAAATPSGSTKGMTDSSYDSNTVIGSFWAAYKAGTAVAFTDRWNKQWLVRMLDFHEAESYQENLKTPGTAMQFTLLELYGTGLESSWDGLNTIWDNPNMTWGTAGTVTLGATEAILGKYTEQQLGAFKEALLLGLT